MNNPIDGQLLALFSEILDDLLAAGTLTAAIRNGIKAKYGI